MEQVTSQMQIHLDTEFGAGSFLITYLKKRQRDDGTLPSFRVLFPAKSGESSQLRYCRRCHHPRRGHTIRSINSTVQMCSLCPDKVCTRCCDIQECKIPQFRDPHKKTDFLTDEEFEMLYQKSMENHKTRNLQIREKKFKIQ